MSTATPDNDASEASVPNTTAAALCLKCHAHPMEYETDPCSHPCFCKACAMKCATGGKCKICHEFFVRLKRI